MVKKLHCIPYGPEFNKSRRPFEFAFPPRLLDSLLKIALLCCVVDGAYKPVGDIYYWDMYCCSIYAYT